MAFLVALSFLLFSALVETRKFCLYGEFPIIPQRLTSEQPMPSYEWGHHRLGGTTVPQLPKTKTNENEGRNYVNATPSKRPREGLVRGEVPELS